MIKKKNNSYRLIKDNIAKLTLIHLTTRISPSNLTAIFLSNFADDKLHLMKKTKDGYWQWDLSSKTPYKYFKRESARYLKNNSSNHTFKTMLEIMKNRYLTNEYVGFRYEDVLLNYRSQESFLKDFVRDSFIKVFPLLPAMTPKERAIRNQRLGKISCDHWIGDIVECDYFSQAPGFMMDNVKNSINMIELYVANLLNDKDLDHDLMKLETNQNLQTKLQPKPQEVKAKIVKI